MFFAKRNPRKFYLIFESEQETSVGRNRKKEEEMIRVMPISWRYLLKTGKREAREPTLTMFRR